MSRLRNVAVVLAGGTGTRLGHEIPKQLIRIGGKAIIEHTIATLQRSPDIDDIIVMMARGYLDEIHEIVRDGDYTKVSRVLEGAGSRNDTTAAAIAALGEDECNVILHDAVRPLVSQTIIAANIAALGDYEAVDTAIPSADTVIQVREDAAEIADVRRATCSGADRRPSPSASPSCGRRTRRPARTRTSPPPTTAPWCSATCPTWPSAWSWATRRT